MLKSKGSILGQKMLLIYKDLQKCPLFRVLVCAFDLIFAVSASMSILDISERSLNRISGKNENGHEIQPFFVKQNIFILGQKDILCPGTCRGQSRLDRRYSFNSAFMAYLFWFHFLWTIFRIFLLELFDIFSKLFLYISAWSILRIIKNKRHRTWRYTGINSQLHQPKLWMFFFDGLNYFSYGLEIIVRQSHKNNLLFVKQTKRCSFLIFDYNIQTFRFLSTTFFTFLKNVHSAIDTQQVRS